MKALEFLTKVLAWLQIAASPLIAGIIIGLIIYANRSDTLGTVLAISVAVSGLITGIILATRIWKKKGTVEFVSRIMATPDLDKQKETKK